MGSVYNLVLIAALSSHCSAYVVSHSETDRSTASVLLKEEQSAEIPCMTKGTGDYFWRKGQNLYNSTLVAYFTVGEVSDDSQPYYVTVNGTLHIRSVTLTDEGNYFCRVSSAENECYGEVKILVQASLRNFDLAIDRCDGESSCLLYLDSSQPTSLTCTALNAAPLMTLKWFNGSNEITEGIEQNEILPQNGNSREITSTVTAVYGHPVSLTCQAVDPKRSNDDVRFAHAQVEMTVPVHESLTTWIIVAGTLAGCFIVYLMLSLIKAWANRKKYKKKKATVSTMEEEKVNLLADKKEKDDEISRLKLSAKAKDTEISKLKKEIAGNEEKIIAAEKKVEQKEQEINNQREQYNDCQTNLQKKEIDLQRKTFENSDLKGNLTQKDDALREITIKLEKSKAIVKEKNVELWNTSKELAELKEKFTRLEELYNNLKGAQQRSQTKPRKKHQGNDGD